MAKLTNTQLIANLEAAHVSYQKLSVECDALRNEVAALKVAAPVVRVIGAPSTARPAYVRFAPSEASVIVHDNYVRAYTAARELAMRSGRAVRVG